MRIADLLKREEPTQKEIVNCELRKINEKLSKIESLYNLTNEDELIEALIFEENALRARYTHLLKMAKEKEISIDYIERDK